MACLEAFKILVVSGQRLDRLGAIIKDLKMKVLLHFTIKISKLARKISRDSVPKDSASIANRIFKKLRIKRWTIMLSLLLKFYAVQGLFVKWEKEL